jgi:hypothetical protein
MKSAITGGISINEIPRLASIRASIVRWEEANRTDSRRPGPPPSQGSEAVSRRARRSVGEEMNWAKDPRVLVCIIAALIFVVWMVLQRQYY